MAYGGYDGTEALRALQGASEIRDAGVARRIRLLQLAQLKRQADEEQQMRDAARGAIVPQQASVTAPDITVQGSDGTMPAANPRVDSYAGIAQPAGVVRRAAPVLDTPPPSTLGMTPRVTIPGATSTVAGPPAFNRDKYTDLIGAANPLLAQQEKSRLAAQDAAAQEKAIEVAGKRVDLGNKITTGRGAQLANAQKEIEAVASLAGPLYQAEQNGATPEQLETLYQRQRQQVDAMVQAGQISPHWSAQLPEHYMQGFGQYAMQAALSAKDQIELHQKAENPTEAGLAYRASGTGPQADRANKALGKLAETKRDSKIVIDRGAEKGVLMSVPDGNGGFTLQRIQPGQQIPEGSRTPTQGLGADTKDQQFIDKTYVKPALDAEKAYRMYVRANADHKNGTDTGAQGMLALSQHLSTTFGNVKGARVTKDLIHEHLGARSISDDALVAVQKITNGDPLSPSQWTAFGQLIKESRDFSWRIADQEAGRAGVDISRSLPIDLGGQGDISKGRGAGSGVEIIRDKNGRIVGVK